MHRLNLVHKPMIIGLKANVGEIAECYRTAYPNSRILYATEKDFSVQNRVKFFNNIKNNDWDCVIMSHDQFGKIPQSPELQQRILQTELDTVEENLEILRHGALGLQYLFGIFGIFSIIAFVFVKIWIPETKGKSLEQIEKEIFKH